MSVVTQGRGARPSWRSLRTDPDYVADWRASAGPTVHEAPPFPFRRQAEADVKAARWNLLAWEDPRYPSLAELFWADAPMVETRTAGDAGRYALCRVVRRSGARFMGLRLRDGALIVKVVKGRRWAQIRIIDGDAFDPVRSGVEIAARTERPGRGARTRVESLDSIGLQREKRRVTSESPAKPTMNTRRPGRF